MRAAQQPDLLILPPEPLWPAGRRPAAMGDDGRRETVPRRHQQRHTRPKQQQQQTQYDLL
eukprot:SAG25_NODE_255_length_10943_cov_46.952047_1_plen_60_part_00